MRKLIPQSIKNIYHLFQAVLANVWHGFPSRRLKVIGVTGTNGKTTTVQMIAKVLEEADFKIAVASTINFKIGKKEWVNDTKFTTFSSFKLQEFLKKAVGAGCEYAIVEVTSHALDQNRVWGVKFDVAVITNITREHLDYHQTMEKYSRAKEKLFAMVRCSSGPTARPKRNADGPRTAVVVNLGMEEAEKFLEYPADEKYGYCLGTQNVERITKGYKLHEIVAENIELGIKETKYQIQNTKFQLNLPGEFNVENALAATCVGLSQNISLEKISASLAKIKGVPGRMERIENDRGLEIIVDYAVTPDSLEKLYNYINGLRKENVKVIAVFGSCGERDRGKRPIMGETVARHADFCIVTNEDPYNEDSERIINEVFNGVINPKSEALNSKQFQNPNFEFQKKVEGINCWRIADRKEAIKKALQIAKPGDIVVITGKGAEETMAVGKKRIPWNDPKVIREILSETSKEEDR